MATLGIVRSRQGPGKAADSGLDNGRCVPSNGSTAIDTVTGHGLDATETEDLSWLEDRYAVLSEVVNDGIIDWDLRSDLIRLSGQAQDLLGIKALVCSRDWLTAVHPADRAGFEAALYHHFDGNSAGFEYQHRVNHNDNSRNGAPPRWLLVRGKAVYSSSGEVTHFTALITDVSDRRRRQPQSPGDLLSDALHDPLTGLANRALLLDRIKQLLDRSLRQTSVRFALMLLELESYQSTSYTPIVGNWLLKAVALRLEQSLRLMDSIARFAGSKLAVLIGDEVDLQGAVRVAERLQEALDKGFMINGRSLVVSASIGICLSQRNHQNPADVLRDADTALERARKTGRARYQVF